MLSGDKVCGLMRTWTGNIKKVSLGGEHHYH